MTIKIFDKIEDSPFIRRRKKAVLNKYSPTRSKTIEKANNLAIYLCATGQFNEAEKMLKSYSENSPFERSRYERWESACFAMLLQAHLMKEKGEIKEFNRLLNITKNDFFTPNNWFKEGDFEEFMSSIRSGMEEVCDLTKNEKVEIRAGGIFALLVALYIWTERWKTFEIKSNEIYEAIGLELKKIRDLIS